MVIFRANRKQFYGDPGELEVYHLNLSSLESVRECAKNLLTNESAIHILINNAGILCPYEKTEDGHEMQLQTNYLGHFLLTLLLLPKMQFSAPGCRIVNVSSCLHRCKCLVILFLNNKPVWDIYNISVYIFISSPLHILLNRMRDKSSFYNYFT